jgi:hypothetical protein
LRGVRGVSEKEDEKNTPKKAPNQHPRVRGDFPLKMRNFLFLDNSIIYA